MAKLAAANPFAKIAKFARLSAPLFPSDRGLRLWWGFKRAWLIITKCQFVANFAKGQPDTKTLGDTDDTDDTDDICDKWTDSQQQQQ
ncbi:MAG: hypothetical protein H0X30_01170 [Anaerolineae bacterium]|nr:hypothetical protein [Anaerolineae bacterium]